LECDPSIASSTGLNVKFKDKHLAGGYLAINKTTIEQMPLVKVPLSQQQPIIKLVDQILLAKQNNPMDDTSMQETEIDKLVYQLYELTAKEIRAVEENIRR
jgi:hypothetical protein